jgi:cell division protein FtsQ
MRTQPRSFQSSQSLRDGSVDVRWLNKAANILYAVAFMLGLAMLLMWFLRLPIFNVGLIVVEGDVVRNSEPTLRANALPLIRGNYFTLNLSQVQRAFESVPWVRHAQLQRIWPNRLRVQLQEHQPVALWAQEQGNDQLVNSFGEVFQANVGDVDDEENLPTLQGPQGTSLQVLNAYLALKPLFATLKLQLEALTLSPRGSWQAQFDTGATIELGRGDLNEITHRVQRFTRTVPQVVARFDRPIVFADLRHHEGYALKLAGVTTTELITQNK